MGLGKSKTTESVGAVNWYTSFDFEEADELLCFNDLRLTLYLVRSSFDRGALISFLRTFEGAEK